MLSRIGAISSIVGTFGTIIAILLIFFPPSNFDFFNLYEEKNETVIDQEYELILTRPAALIFGNPGLGKGEFDSPSGITTDSNDNVYVADSINHRIQKFTSSGEFITSWGSEGSGDGEFNFPSGIAVHCNDVIFVTDSLNRIQVFFSD